MRRQRPHSVHAARELQAGQDRRRARRRGVGSAVWLALLALGCPQLLEDGFTVGDAALDGPLDTLSSQGGAAALDGDSGSAGRLGPAGGPPPRDGSANPGPGHNEASGALCANGRSDPGEQGIDCGGACPACGCIWTPFGAPEKLIGLGFPATASQWGPALSPDASTLIVSNSTVGVAEDLYRALRPDRGAAFSVATAVTELNTSADEGTAFFGFNGLSLYFYSGRAGVGGRDIYVSTRASALDPFRAAGLAGGVNSSSSDHLPWVSPDELRMYFTSNRTPTEGGYDLYVATRSTPSAAFGNVRALSELDTSSSDEGASLMADELTIFFSSNRGGGAGKSDIWSSTRATKAGVFSAPVNVAVVNTAADELNVSVSADGRELFFSSDRGAGTSLPHVIWRSIRSCE